jgi:hypothetical protein
MAATITGDQGKSPRLEFAAISVEKGRMRARVRTAQHLGLIAAALLVLTGSTGMAQRGPGGPPALGPGGPAPQGSGGSGGGVISTSPGLSLMSPGGGIGSPAPTMIAPAMPAQVAPLPSAAPMVPAGQVALYLNARFGRDLPPITGGMVWRIYPERPDNTGVFKIVREEKTAAPTFLLPPGNYVVHAAFGHAQATKMVHLRAETVREVFDIPAGGIRIEGKVGDVKIPNSQIHYDIYRGSQFEPGDKRPMAQNMVTGDVMLVPEGTYHIVSHYGDGNAVVRSDIRVQTGKVTDVTVTHRAAVITLKLVEKAGGEAIANTQWSVLTPGGDVIKESIGAFPRVILSEGEYRVIARNEGKSFQHDFKVITGVDSEISVVAR